MASGGRWVSLGSFGDETKLEALAKSFERDPSLLRHAPFVVVDLRGNAGGNSTWGERFARILWGDAAVKARTAEIDGRPGRRAGKYWRASPAVAVAARAQADEFKAMGSDYASVAGYWYEVADRIARAPDGDHLLVHDPCCDRVPPTKKIPLVTGDYTKPVYVLIDAGCFSSCVLAADRLIEQGAIAVGETTGQNEEYGEIATPPPLPSGLARYFLPISIIRQPKDTLRIVPQIAWQGAMDDDAGIETWIAKLAVEQPRNTSVSAGAPPRLASTLAAQNIRDFDFMVDKISANYAGYDTKIAGDGRAKLVALTSRLRAQVASAGGEQLAAQMTEWTKFFRDEHTQVSALSRGNDGRNASGSILRLPWSEAGVMKQLTALGERRLPVEGLWAIGGARSTSRSFSCPHGQSPGPTGPGPSS